VWTGGLLIYVVGVFHRFSMSVAGVDAVDRLGVTRRRSRRDRRPAGRHLRPLQVPVGMLVDRNGYRRTLLPGAVAMAAGQVALAFATGLVPALAARSLVAWPLPSAPYSCSGNLPPELVAGALTAGDVARSAPRRSDEDPGHGRLTVIGADAATIEQFRR
jgi:hypothetical protein